MEDGGMDETSKSRNVSKNVSQQFSVLDDETWFCMIHTKTKSCPNFGEINDTFIYIVTFKSLCIAWAC
jgi:hypothetical protein